jgi:hypothetical protein
MSFDAAGGIGVTEGNFYREAAIKYKPDSTDRTVRFALPFTNGLRSCVFWRNWVVWLKDSAMLRR